MKEKRFNPNLAPNPEGLGSVLPNAQLGIPSWASHADSWWGGATIGYPELRGALAAHRTLRKVTALYSQINEGKQSAADEMHELFIEKTDECRNSLLEILGITSQDATVILETSGTSALALTRHLLPLEKNDVLVTTTEEGNLVKPVLMGRDPWNYPKSAFYENVQLFTKHKATDLNDFHTETNKVVAIEMMRDNEWKTNDEILAEVRSLLNSGTVACLVIPLVTKTGRLLPVKEIGYEIKKHNALTNRKVTYIVDAIQALGRTDAESITNPLEYCDVFICSSSKALGGIVIASAVVAKKELVEHNLSYLLQSSYAPHLRFYQFDHSWSDILNPVLSARTEHQAISLPEIASFTSVLQSHLARGNGKTYSHRRENQLNMIYNHRLKVLAALEHIPQVLLVNGSDDNPVVPSIITWRADASTASARQVKTMLQDPNLGSVVTLCATVGHLLRLEIPEYRELPKIDKLSTKLEKVFAGK